MSKLNTKFIITFLGIAAFMSQDTHAVTSTSNLKASITIVDTCVRTFHNEKVLVKCFGNSPNNVSSQTSGDAVVITY